MYMLQLGDICLSYMLHIYYIFINMRTTTVRGDFFFKISFYFCAGVCIHMSMCHTCVCGTHRYQKSASDFPGAGATGSLWHLIPDQTPFLCPTPGHALPQWTVSLPYLGSASKGLPLFTALSGLLVSHAGVACICPYPIGALPPPALRCLFTPSVSKSRESSTLLRACPSVPPNGFRIEMFRKGKGIWRYLTWL